MLSHFAHNTTTNPSSLLVISRHKPLVRIQNTPNRANLTPKHPFSWPELEGGRNELPSGQNGPQLSKMFEKWTKLF